MIIKNKLKNKSPLVKWKYFRLNCTIYYSTDSNEIYRFLKRIPSLGTEDKLKELYEKLLKAGYSEKEHIPRITEKILNENNIFGQYQIAILEGVDMQNKEDLFFQKFYEKGINLIETNKGLQKRNASLDVDSCYKLHLELRKNDQFKPINNHLKRNIFKENYRVFSHVLSGKNLGNGANSACIIGPRGTGKSEELKQDTKSLPTILNVGEDKNIVCIYYSAETMGAMLPRKLIYYSIVKLFPDYPLIDPNSFMSEQELKKYNTYAYLIIDEFEEFYKEKEEINKESIRDVVSHATATSFPRIGFCITGSSSHLYLLLKNDKYIFQAYSEKYPAVDFNITVNTTKFLPCHVQPDWNENNFVEQLLILAENTPMKGKIDNNHADYLKFCFGFNLRRIYNSLIGRKGDITIITHKKILSKDIQMAGAFYGLLCEKNNDLIQKFSSIDILNKNGLLNESSAKEIFEWLKKNGFPEVKFINIRIDNIMDKIMPIVQFPQSTDYLAEMYLKNCVDDHLLYEFVESNEYHYFTQSILDLLIFHRLMLMGHSPMERFITLRNSIIYDNYINSIF